MMEIFSRIIFCETDPGQIQARNDLGEYVSWCEPPHRLSSSADLMHPGE